MASDSRLESVHEDSERCQEHEVFFSHSGRQKSFVHGLFKEFLNYPRFQFNKPFFDVDRGSLPKGREWRDRLIKAARNCKVAILILTDVFLTSRWPMLELLHFIDAQKKDNRGMHLLPVFFDGLSPSDLDDGPIENRWKGEWERIISRARPSAGRRRLSLTVESCTEALKFLKLISGIKHDTSQPYDLVYKEIVTEVLNFLPSGFDPELDPNVEGCKRLCQDIDKMFQEFGYSGTLCLGLYGMGGSGKTTMCKALCSYLGPSVNHMVYHLQIGCNEPLKSQANLMDRHKELLKKLFGLSQDEVDRIHDPRQILKMHLKKQPVFLAVDDVREDLESCQEVRAYLSYLCPGSKMIITARSQEIVQSVVGCPNYCKPIPVLEELEALSLFLKIAAPTRCLDSLRPYETLKLQECLQICFFSRYEGTTTHNQDAHVPKKLVDGHYHPLALRAIASYFNDRHSKLRDIVQCAEELLRKKKLLFYSDVSKRIFDVLGFGFNEICHVGKQLFVDVALYAPRGDGDGDEGITFSWLLDINVNLERDALHMQLEHLRKLSFLHYEDPTDDDRPTCMNISMHDLYRDYAKRLVNEHKDEESYKYGVCNGRSYHYAPRALATKGWARAPRIRLKRWEEVVTETDWSTVSVIHLVHCEMITIFSLGPNLVNLRELKIYDCSNLEELAWTSMTERQLKEVLQLCFVELVHNQSLKGLPDFSNCSKLRELVITECHRSAGPLHLHTCPDLQLLDVSGETAPEVRSLQSCSQLSLVRLAWRDSHKGLLLHDLPSLSDLTILGPSVRPRDAPNECVAPHGHSLFCQHYPEETTGYELTGVEELKKLETLRLEYIPLGCLPKGLTNIGSSLEYLSLRGCLLSQLMDFSAFPNLQYLFIAQTNVKALRGSCLKKLVHLDCRFNFRLQEIPDLRPYASLQHLSLDQCPELRAIPRLPRSYYRNTKISTSSSEKYYSRLPSCDSENPLTSEDHHRLLLAFDAFVNTTACVIPPPMFAWISARDHISDSSENLNTLITIQISDLSLSRELPNPLPHYGISCDGCAMQPLTGPRYKARDIITRLVICNKCFTNKCHESDCKFPANGSAVESYKITRMKATKLNYDLCYACFVESGCDERDFIPGIHVTNHPSINF